MATTHEMEEDDDIIRSSCSFRNIENTKKPTIAGKIVDILPLIKKSRVQACSVLIVHCIDASLGESESSRKFKIMFLGESATKLSSLKVAINDYIAIRNAHPVHDYAYNSNTDLFYSKLMIVKSLSKSSKRVLLKRNKGEWRTLETALLDTREESQLPIITNTKNKTERTEELVSSSNGVNLRSRNVVDDSDVTMISSSDWLAAKKTTASSQAPSNEPDRSKAGTSNRKSSKDTRIHSSQNLTSSSKEPSKIRSPESLMQGIVRCHQHKNDKNLSQLKNVYTKLADVRENMVINIVAVIFTVPSIPAKISTNKFCEFIYIVDDTNSNGFRVRLTYDRKVDRPVVQPHSLILCQEMKIFKAKNELCGSVSSSQLVTFDKDDPKICYKNSSNFSLTPEDQERVEQLRSWMYENIPMARPFTPLASISIKNETVNLRCQIVAVKDYDKNIIVLRVTDGTTCEVPFYRVPFECDSWQKALTEMKTYREPSKEIDIIVHVAFDYLYKKFKVELKAGFVVELFNVNLKLVPDPVKTKPGNSLKAYLEGDAQNIRATKNKNKVSWINWSNEKSVPKVSEKKSKLPINQLANKRKLFEHSPRVETEKSDDSDFESCLDVIVVSHKKKKSVETLSDYQPTIVRFQDIGPTTSSTSLTHQPTMVCNQDIGSKTSSTSLTHQPTMVRNQDIGSKTSSTSLTHQPTMVRNQDIGSKTSSTSLTHQPTMVRNQDIGPKTSSTSLTHQPTMVRNQDISPKTSSTSLTHQPTMVRNQDIGPKTSSTSLTHQPTVVRNQDIGPKTSSTSLTHQPTIVRNQDIGPKTSSTSLTHQPTMVRNQDISPKISSTSLTHQPTIVRNQDIGPTTSSTSLTRAKNPDTNKIQDVLPKDNPPPKCTQSTDEIQVIDIPSNTHSTVIQVPDSPKRVPGVSITDTKPDPISLAHDAREKDIAKVCSGRLHQAFKSVAIMERKEIQKRLSGYNTINDVSNYLVQWPLNPGDEAFYIQVTIMSSVPFINAYSTHFDLMALIGLFCTMCDRVFPYHLVKWIVSEEDGPVGICPKCKERDVMSTLRQELFCELLLNDDFGTVRNGVVMGHHAENFFGCTLSQLCTSVEAEIRVRTFMDSHLFTKGKEKKPLIVKAIRIYSPQHNVHKYHILS